MDLCCFCMLPKTDRRRRFLTATLMAAMAVLAVAAAAQTHEKADFYYFENHQIYLRVDLSALGILVPEEAEPGARAKLTASLEASVEEEGSGGVSVTETYRGGLYVLRFEEPRKRGELVRLAAELRRRYPRDVAQAGLVLRGRRGEAPVIATGELIAHFGSQATRDEIEHWNRSQGVRQVMANPFVERQVLLEITDPTAGDVLAIAQRYHESPLTIAAYPNFINVFYDTETVPNDTFFGNQWHHRNTSQSGGTADADADTSWAWDITQGTAATTVSVLENGGYDLTHPDLVPNFWVNPGEIPGNGVDDDSNTYVDDVNGWDFVGCTAMSGPGCGDNSPAAVGNEDHGTAVAGVAGARGANALWVSGSCPNCSLMLLRTGYVASDFAKSLAFGYAQQAGSRIVTNSWGGGGATPNTVAAINAATAAGVVVLFASGNTTANVCGTDPRVSLPGVIAVSSSSNQDRKVFTSAIGNCIDVLAPSHRGYSAAEPYTGTLNVTTTDRTGTAGYNNTNTNPTGPCPTAEPAPPPASDRDYTHCFGGTSSATPLTAGIVALALDVAPALTRPQVQSLLQDTADRVEDSVGAYSDVNGFSNPGGAPTHAWGRVNAFEAVRVVAPAAQGGKDGIDVFLRDNRLDWGNTEQASNRRFEAVPGFIGHWRSMDVKVDAPPYAAAPTAANFDAFADETPSATTGELNRVYVRVRNRGPSTAESVTVKLHWAQFGAGLPPLASDFWTAFPTDPAMPSSWTPLSCAGSASTVCTLTDLAYSGASVAGTVGDAGQIAQFDFPAPPIDPMLPNHFCLLAMVDTAQDPISAASQATLVVDTITPNDNNVTHRNYHDLVSDSSDEFREVFFVRNPFEHEILTRVHMATPEGWRAWFEGFRPQETFRLAAGEERLLTIRMRPAAPTAEGEVTIVQENVEPAGILGGLTYRFRTSKAVPQPTTPTTAGSESSYLIGAFSFGRGEQATVRVINPTGKKLRLLAAFFDDDERPLRCLRDTLSANDLLEIELRQLDLGTESGVVKLVSLDAEQEAPRRGIVGSIQHRLQSRKMRFKYRTVSETSLHPISEETLKGDLERIREACGM